MMTMVLLAVAAAVCAAGAVFLLLNARYRRSHYYRNYLVFENRIAHKADVPAHLDFVNTGSVMGRFAFAYDRYGGRGFSFAQNPQCLEMDHHLLQQFSDRLEKGCTVCITLPVFIFGFERYPQLRYNAKYYGCMDAAYIHGYSPVYKAVCTRFPLLLAGKHGIYALWDRPVPCEMAYETCAIPEAKRERQLQGRVDSWLRQFQLNDLKKAELSHLRGAMAYTVPLLTEMIDFCLARGWRPVLVTTPLCKELNEMFSQEFLDAMFYDNIKAANTRGIPYLDFRTCAPFQEDIDLFWNGVDWLSAKGRRLFMELLTKRLSEEGLL